MRALSRATFYGGNPYVDVFYRVYTIKQQKETQRFDLNIQESRGSNSGPGPTLICVISFVTVIFFVMVFSSLYFLSILQTHQHFDHPHFSLRYSLVAVPILSPAAGYPDACPDACVGASGQWTRESAFNRRNVIIVQRIVQ